MRQFKLAIVFPVGQETENDNTLRQILWGKAAELLTPQLGKYYTRFEPAVRAWNQDIDRPYGVILGKSDPALFLYFYAAAKAHQADAIKFHMGAFLDSMELTDRCETDGATIYSVSLNGSGEEVHAHMLWHIAMMGGKIMNDCGIYYALQRQAVASNALDQDILEHATRYALCMVTLIAEEGDGTHEQH